MTPVGMPPVVAAISTEVTGSESEHLARLIARCAHGCESSFVELYRRTQAQVHAAAFRLLRSLDHAVEVVQETYLEVWVKAGQYDPARGTVLTWLATIVHRRSIDRIRSVQASRVRDTRDAELTVAVDEADVSDAIAARLDTRDMHRALLLLTPFQRQAVVMRYLEECPMQEIADRLALPLSTAKSRVRDGLLRLRELLSAATANDLDPSTRVALGAGVAEADLACLVAATGLGRVDLAGWLAHLDARIAAGTSDLDAYLTRLEQTPGVRSLNEDLVVACLRARYARDNTPVMHRAERAVEHSRSLTVRSQVTLRRAADLRGARPRVDDRGSVDTP